jgi:hypothetical protein
VLQPDTLLYALNREIGQDRKLNFGWKYMHTNSLFFLLQVPFVNYNSAMKMAATKLIDFIYVVLYGNLPSKILLSALSSNF